MAKAFQDGSERLVRADQNLGRSAKQVFQKPLQGRGKALFDGLGRDIGSDLHGHPCQLFIRGIRVGQEPKNKRFRQRHGRELSLTLDHAAHFRSRFDGRAKQLL